MSQLQARLEGDLVAARKAQDRLGVLLLGTVLSEIKNRRIELQRQPTDEEVVEVLQRGIKKRRESIEMYSKGARDDLAQKEQAEVDALGKYLPEQVGDDDILAAVRAAISGGAAQIGAVMGKVAPGFKGRADGSRINAIAREELAKQG